MKIIIQLYKSKVIIFKLVKDKKAKAKGKKGK